MTLSEDEQLAEVKRIHAEKQYQQKEKWEGLVASQPGTSALTFDNPEPSQQPLFTFREFLEQQMYPHGAPNQGMKMILDRIGAIHTMYHEGES